MFKRIEAQLRVDPSWLRVLFGSLCARISTNPYTPRGRQVIAGSARRPEGGTARQRSGTVTANFGHAWHHGG